MIDSYQADNIINKHLVPTSGLFDSSQIIPVRIPIIIYSVSYIDSSTRQMALWCSDFDFNDTAQQYFPNIYAFESRALLLSQGFTVYYPKGLVCRQYLRIASFGDATAGNARFTLSFAPFDWKQF